MACDREKGIEPQFNAVNNASRRRRGARMPETTERTERTGDVAASRREARRRQRQELSRAQLLDAAEAVFGRKGFHETTLREVAELAEFSVGSVYSFFESKDDLFRQVLARRGDEFMAPMRALLAPPLGGTGAVSDPVVQLHQLVDHQVGFFRAHPSFGRLFLRHASLDVLTSGVVDPVIVANLAEAMALQADLFRRGQQAGCLRSGDPDGLARLFSGLVAAYQAVDVEAPTPEGALDLATLHAVVAGAFVV
jgi:TetR/AcrR family transcriptional regulator